MQPIADAKKCWSDFNMGHDRRRAADLMRSGSIVVEAFELHPRTAASPVSSWSLTRRRTSRTETRPSSTRVGHGTKIIFTGDPYQIDNPTWTSSSNGSITSSAVSDQPRRAH